MIGKSFGVAMSLVCIWNLSAAASLVDEVAARQGELIEVPPGRHEIDAPLIFTADGGGLYGPGTIVQTNPAVPVVRVDGARDVRIEGVTLTRPEGAQDAAESALRADNATGLIVRNVRVLDNHSQSGSVRLEHCARTVISGCEIINYKTIGIDDRTTSPLYGYAFQCIDGTGLVVNRCVQTTIANNCIIEERLLPTPETKEAHQLGTLTDGREPMHPGELAKGVAERGYVDNWHQGSAMVVTGPEETRHTLIQGNLIVNAAQGIDLHCDYANVSGNVIDRCMIGIKGTHGCFGLVVDGNTITGADLWGILFNPGAASHGTAPAEVGGEPRAWNGDAGLVISNNLVAEYGYGNEYWNWGGREADAPSSYAIAFLNGQLASNPPVTGVVLSGNSVLAGGRDVEPGAAQRYRYAVYMEGWDGDKRLNPTAIRGITATGNHFEPGLRGVCNGTLDADTESVTTP
ncbi:MAG: hypothetical protein GC168_06220 [Candidatus Hydrogenedens sp.]|nr:hypothetical protein [Candidatus Hydrogenedens sp.]